MTALAAEGTQRAAVLEHLALVPELTAGELARVIGARTSLTQLLAAMEHRAEVVSRTEWRPQQGRQVHVWRLAPPGTVPPPRPEVPADVLARRRERDRITQQARRARRRAPVDQPIVAVLPGAACVGTDPSLFFPDPGDLATESEAQAICAGCPVRDECRAGAVRRGERWGIWGGVNFEVVHGLPAAASRSSPSASAPARGVTSYGSAADRPRLPSSNLTRGLHQ